MTLPTKFRFWSRVERAGDGCWIWAGQCRSNGYGSFHVRRPDGSWTTTTAHRWAYTDQVGPVPHGFEVDHLCRQRACVRPDHLEAVSLQVNRQRRDSKYAPPVDRSPLDLPDFPRPAPPPTKAPRNPHLCKNGHDRRVLGVASNGARATCRACRLAQAERNRKGGKHGTETHCPRGHPYSGDNLYVRPEGHRECRTCVVERSRDAYRRRRAANPVVLDCADCGYRAGSGAGLAAHRRGKH